MDTKQQSLEVFRGVLRSKAVDVADRITEAIIEGNYTPSYLGVVLKKFEKISEIALKNAEVKEIIINDVKSYLGDKGKTVELHGSKIQIANKRYWIFTETEDPYLEALTEIEKQIKVLKKSREDELKAKSKAWNSINKPETILSEGLKPFVVTWEELPKLVMEEGIGEVHTNPPIEVVGEQIKFFV